MLRSKKILIAFFIWSLSLDVLAQARLQTGGTLVTVSASGEVRQDNDEATVVFLLEEQDKDKVAAASRVNQKMKQGIDLLKKEDPRAKLRSYGYYTYAVYPDEQVGVSGRVRKPVAWRAGQYLELKTTDIGHLPKTVAAGQRILALNGLQFGLSGAALHKLDQKRIETTYENLTERIGFMAKAMKRDQTDVQIESIELEPTASDLPEPLAGKYALRQARPEAGDQVSEPSFEEGETVLQMRMVAKVRFK